MQIPIGSQPAKGRPSMQMKCEARTQLLNELSRAVAAYHQAVHDLINRNGSAPAALFEQVRQMKAECSASREALLKHEVEHGCSLVLAAQTSTMATASGY